MIALVSDLCILFTFRVPTRSDTNLIRGLKFWTKEVESM